MRDLSPSSCYLRRVAWCWRRREREESKRAFAATLSLVYYRARTLFMRRFRTGKTASYVVLAMALFVFLFALNAKLSLCRPVGPEHSRTAFKLYLNGQKLTIRHAIEGPGLLLSGILTAIVFAFCSLRVSHRFHFDPAEQLFRRTDLFSHPHFFRPPPALA
jgi:hypothetical protein